MVPIAALTAFCALFCGAARAEGLSRGPYIVAASSTAAQICWRFKGQDGCYTFDTLTPGATFSYAFGGSSQSWTGQALPSSAQALTFAAFGNLGEDADRTRRLADVVRAIQPHMVVVLGDIVPPAGADIDYEARYFRPLGGLLSSVAFFTVVGDGDYGGFASESRGAKRFDEGYARVHRKPRYYSFDAGPAHFAALDTAGAAYIRAAASLSLDSEQRRWLEDDLARSRARWKIALVHVPLYSTMRYHGENEMLRQSLEPLFKKYGVDAVFQAHDRVYERGRPASGILYITAGTGGEKLDKKKETSPDWLESRVSSYGVVVVSLDSAQMKVEFRDDGGVVRDSFTLTKGN